VPRTVVVEHRAVERMARRRTGEADEGPERDACEHHQQRPPVGRPVEDDLGAVPPVLGQQLSSMTSM
jgi:hypothetical protein